MTLLSPIGLTSLALFCLFNGFCCGWTASQKNRNGEIWFLTGCFLGPYGLLMLMAVPALAEKVHLNRQTASA